MSSSSSFSSCSSSAHPSPSPYPAGAFLDQPQLEKMTQAAIACGNVVCQVLTTSTDKRGSGCLIRSVLLLTNHHVLPDIETARGGFACFFKVASRDCSAHPNQEDCAIKAIKIPLDPDRFFFTSPAQIRDGVPMAASKDYLDFTVVALKPAPYLSRIQKFVLFPFHEVILRRETPVYVVQCPKVMGATDVVEGGLKWSEGLVKEVGKYSMTYSATAAPGSSGGIVVDSEGRLIALHHQMHTTLMYRSKQDAETEVLQHDYVGVRIQKIAAALMDQKDAMDKVILETDLPPDLRSGNIIGLPATATLFTGREKELATLKQACSGEAKRVAIVGLGGMGKTALAVKYANDHQSDYSLICFIPSGTRLEIENGLFNLAEVLEIREQHLERKLLALKTKLERNQEKFLLIFDGVDDEETMAYVCDQLPQRGCTTILVSSRLQGSAENPDFVQLPLIVFNPEDAVLFLLRAVGQKDTHAEQAALLAEELHYLPLALKHAAAFISSTEGYTFNSYLEGLRSIGVTLLGPDYVPRQGTREETILTTWKKSMDAILEAPHGGLAADILYLFSLFAEAPIPTEVLEWLTFAKEEERKTAVKQLTNYSLLDRKENGYVLHGLLQKVIRVRLGKALGVYLLQGLQKLTDFLKNVDEKDPKMRRRLDPYIPHLEAIVESAKKLPPIHSAKIDTLLVKLFSYYFYDGKENDYKRTSETMLRYLNEQNPNIHSRIDHEIELASHYEKTGVHFDFLGRSEEAFSCHQQALGIRKLKLGDDHPTTANSYYSVGVSLGYLSRHEEALFYFQKALEIRKLKLGDDHPTTAESYYSVGITLGYLRRHEKALPYAQRALEIRKEKLGDDHPTTADSYSSVGVILHHLGRHEEALLYFQNTLETRKLKLGDDHRETADSYQNVGVTLNCLGKHEEALPYAQRALEIRKEKLGDDHPTTADSYSSVGVILHCLGRHEEALLYFQDTLEARKLKLGDDHLTTADSYYCVGITLHCLGRHEEALLYFQDTIETRKLKLGDDHLTTADSYYRVGITLHCLGRHEEALSYGQRVLEIRKLSLDDDY